MPHVSRHTPTKKVTNHIFEKLIEWATSKGSAHQRKTYLTDLLTPTERIMLSKRFAIIYMLQKGYSFDAIQEVLRVSPSTINRVWQALQKGKYAHISRQINTPQYESLLKIFNDFIPPMSMTKKQYRERMRRLDL